MILRVASVRLIFIRSLQENGTSYSTSGIQRISISYQINFWQSETMVICAIKDGALRCWGLQYYANLGNGYGTGNNLGDNEDLYGR